MSASADTAASPAAIEAALAAYSPAPAQRARLREAAVLVPLVATPTGVELQLILRPNTMPTHPGQVAFPGGAVDPGDADSWAAALREADEELGIPANAVTRVGRLDDLPTITSFHVTPWVGWIPPDLALRPSPREVDEAFRVPLSTLLDPSRRRTMVGRWRGRPRRMYFYLTERHVVWGATAEMLTNFLSIIRPA